MNPSQDPVLPPLQWELPYWILSFYVIPTTPTPPTHSIPNNLLSKLDHFIPCFKSLWLLFSLGMWKPPVMALKTPHDPAQHCPPLWPQMLLFSPCLDNTSLPSVPLPWSASSWTGEEHSSCRCYSTCSLPTFRPLLSIGKAFLDNPFYNGTPVASLSFIQMNFPLSFGMELSLSAITLLYLSICLLLHHSLPLQLKQKLQQDKDIALSPDNYRDVVN